MQIVRTMPVCISTYVNQSVHATVKPPCQCPHCHAQDKFEALGYYSRNVTNTGRGVSRISVRRFRCLCCGRTVSILPSFAQPYRLVINSTISEFFTGSVSATALSWLPLLKQYWNRFANWVPKIGKILRTVTQRAPPQPEAAAWWEVIAAVFGGIENITTTLVSQFGVTLFGRYRCHSPCLANPAVC